MGGSLSGWGSGCVLARAQLSLVFDLGFLVLECSLESSQLSRRLSLVAALIWGIHPVRLLGIAGPRRCSGTAIFSHLRDVYARRPPPPSVPPKSGEERLS